MDDVNININIKPVPTCHKVFPYPTWHEVIPDVIDLLCTATMSNPLKRSMATLRNAVSGKRYSRSCVAPCISFDLPQS